MKRRDWLRAAAAAPLTSTPLLSLTQALAATPPGSVARQLGAVEAGAAVRRLVLVELSGANDGLNTIVPWRNEHYQRLRPSLKLGRDALVDLDADTGLAKPLDALMPLAEQGELAIVQGLGYPQHNRSHFASIGLWETGGDGRAGPGRDGWLVHDIEHNQAFQALREPHGIALDGGIGPLRSDGGRWLTAASAAQLVALSVPDETVSAAGTVLEGGGSAALKRVASRVGELDSALATLTRRLADSPPIKPLGRGKLGAQLTEVARFIAAGLATPVYRVRHSGYDTHVNQRGRHDRLLRELAASLAGFRRQLMALGEWQQTLVVTYSEFGRRAAENESGGTDHGTAAPHFVMGGALGSALGRSPLIGQQPALDTLVDGDPLPTMDYRAVYERLLSGGFGVVGNRFADWRDPRLDELLAG